MVFTQPLNNTPLLEWIQNTTIEERVALLEIKVVVIQDDISGIEEDVTDLDEDVTLLEGDVNFLFDETVIQDERIYNLEQTSIEIDEEVEGYNLLMHKNIDENKFNPMNFDRYHFVTDLQATTTTLDFRVTVLEENGGSGGNSSVVELEVRVEALEGRAADHETRISTVEFDLAGTFNVNY